MQLRALTVFAIIGLALFIAGLPSVGTLPGRSSARRNSQPSLYLYNGHQLDEPRSREEDEWLQRRKAEQEDRARDYKVFHDFKFKDRLPESGITFKHTIVDDSGRNYKAIHYDHRSGIAVADVDGDGLYDIYFVTQLAVGGSKAKGPKSVTQSANEAIKRGDNSVYVYLISAVAAVGGFLFGYDLSIVSAAVIFLKSQFSLIAVQVGFAVSSATIGCICGLLFGGMIVARIGRNKTLALTAAIYGIGAVGSALPSNMVEFDAFRILGGVGVGIASVVFLMYIAEVPPACMRGLLVTINQVAVVSGALSSIIVGYFLAASGNWRAMFASAAIPVLAIIDWTDLYSREPALVDGSRGR